MITIGAQKQVHDVFFLLIRVRIDKLLLLVFDESINLMIGPFQKAFVIKSMLTWSLIYFHADRKVCDAN